MKIVKLADLNEEGRVCTSIDLSDVEIVDIRDTNSVNSDNIRGRIEFNHGVGWANCDCWWLGGAYGLRVTFEGGTTAEFTNLKLNPRYGNRDNIDATVKQLIRLVFGNDDVIGEPETDMPDIF